jgi:RNA polymerase sigma factor (sigma-70 family)
MKLTRNDNLLEAVLDGNSQVIMELNDMLSKFLFKYNRSFKISDTEVEDVVQDSLFVIAEKGIEGSIDRSTKLKSYLCSVGLNLLKKKAIAKSQEIVTLVADFEEDEIIDQDKYENKFNNLEWQLFDKAFNQLGKECKTLFELFFLKTSKAEICKTLGYSSENYVRNKLYRCKKQIITIVQEIQETPKITIPS